MTPTPHQQRASLSWLQGNVATAPWRVSVNQLKTWNKCQRRYELHHLRQLQWPSDPSNFAYGQAVHTLMDYQARQLNCESLLRDATLPVQQAWQWLQANETTHWPVVASEWGFTVPAPPHPLLQHVVLAGRMDRISLSPSGLVVLADWKTGTAVPKDPVNDWQTRVYLYALAEAKTQLGLADDFPFESFSFRYVSVKNGIKVTDVPYSEAFHNETIEKLTNTLISMVTATRFPLPTSCPDRFCGYTQVCGIQSLAETSASTPSEEFREIASTTSP